jgi:uncharacterized protein (DUF1800 family)
VTDALIALNRFGLGERPGQAVQVAADPQAWLRAQLRGAPPARPVPEGAAATDIAAALRAFRSVVANNADERSQQAYRRAVLQVSVREGTSAIATRIASERPFVERLVAFWSDHLCVSIGSKFLVGPLAGSYERDVIRAHVFGRFEEIVLASVRHPAMLIYLDNAQSIGPRSTVVTRARTARARGRGGQAVQRVAERGLNENYARELLELHTLGVNGGYTQADVTELARLLTGWGFVGNNGETAPAYRFFAERHEPGRKTVVGQRYGDGEDEGVKAVRALCRHPSTATHIATKLVRHFVSDEPPPDAVDRVARVFRETDGDLRLVSEALVALPQAWTPEAFKFRTPQDWLVAVLRSRDLQRPGPAPLDALRQLRQPLWAPPSPKGFGDLERDWADPDALLNRAELSRTLARRVLANAGQSAVDELALKWAGPDFQWR